MSSAVRRLPERLTASSELDWTNALNTLGGTASLVTIGRGSTLAIAREAALKLKETCNLHAEAFSGAEFLHGPIALVTETLPVVFVATKDAYHEKIVSNIQEIKARKGKVLAVISQDDELIPKMADDIMPVPEADELLAPLLSVIPLQLFAYYLGVAKGCDVDKPRNLAKSVTVE